MSTVRDQKTAERRAPIDLNENAGAGPLTPPISRRTYRFNPGTTSMRTRLEKVGYWVLVVAGLALLLVLLGIFLPRFVGAMITASIIAAFVGMLSLMNLPRPSGWANVALGRKVFPVLRAPDGEIMRLATTNAAMVFVFTFLFEMVASFVGAFFGGLIVFGALIAAAVFYNRIRTVVIKP
jgi:hypothetical protein